MNGRRAYILMALISVTVSSACASYPVITPEVATPETELRLRFAVPRIVTFRTETGDTLVLGNVVEVRGRMMERRGDSIAIRATRAELSQGEAPRLGSGTTAAFALADLEMQEVDSHPGRTILLIAAVGFVVLVAVAAASLEDAFDESLPPPSDDKQK
jgi:hypothetical protein